MYKSAWQRNKKETKPQLPAYQWATLEDGRERENKDTTLK